MSSRAPIFQITELNKDTKDLIKITPKMARDMRAAYQNHDKALKNANGKTLEYIRIKKADIDKLISANAEEFLIMFAVNFDTYRNPDQTKQHFSVVLAGAKTMDGKMKIMKEPVFNKFNPCPDNCLEYESTAERVPGTVDCTDALQSGKYCKPTP